MTDFSQNQKSLKRILKKHIKKHNSSVEFGYFYTDDVTRFSTIWNAMVGVNFVVFNCHAEPTLLLSGIDNNNKLTYTDIRDKFKYYKEINFIIMLGCNAGRLNYEWENIGCILSTKISGCVVCSDGVVIPSITTRVYKANSDASNDGASPGYEWFYFVEKNGKYRYDGYGWVVYTCRNGVKKHFLLDNKGKKIVYSITFDSVLAYVSANKLYK